MQGNLTPLRGTVQDEDYVANLRGFESGAGNTRFLKQAVNLEQACELESSAYAPEFPNVAGKFLLAFDPGAVAGG